MPEKILETKNCKHCDTWFNITDTDLEFYEKISPVFWWNKYLIPSPTLCPECRHQRRLSFLNQRNLYKNICLKCNKDIISRFHIESWIKNYCNECWSSEEWDQLEFWVAPDFTKSMFSQFWELVKKTVFQNLIWSSSNVTNNAVYTSHTSEIKDSYFVFEANTIENSLFCFGIKNSIYAVDCNFVWNSQYVYECTDSYDMYNCFYTNKSFGCKFSYFLDNCYNCSYCIWCSNLNNKSYHIFNKPVSKWEYEEYLIKLWNHQFIIKFREQFNEFLKNRIVKALNIVWSENCLWDNIINSKNCINSYDVLECSDSKYCTNINYSTDLFDISSYWEESNKMFESVSVWRYSNNILFSSIVWKGEKLIYCIDVKKSKDCFLCVNLEWKQYCILNKQYTKSEYEELVPKIIEHMKKTWEWWEFLPSSISPFWYNETVAMEYFPLTPEKVRGFNWSNYETPFPKVDKIIPANKLPDTISEIPDDILNWAIESELESTDGFSPLYRIIGQELEFYRKHNLPIPRRHPDQRHLDRMSLRNPRKLYDRKCDKCWVDMKTTYSPERPEKVYCEKCYEKEIY